MHFVNNNKVSPSPEDKVVLQLISRNEDKSLVTVTAEQRELFSPYRDCIWEYQAIAECLLFRTASGWVQE